MCEVILPWKKYLASCYPMYTTAPQAGSLLSFLQSLHFCLRTPHPSSVSSCSPFTAICLGQILPKFTHLVSNWTRFCTIPLNKCSISGNGKNEQMQARFLSDKSDKQLMGRENNREGEEREATKWDAEDKVAVRVGGWWRREIAYSRFTHLHQTAWHIWRYLTTHRNQK